MKIFYDSLDVTDLCYSRLITNNHIIIPADDNVRARLFTDPEFGKLKKIYINGVGYAHNLLIKINITTGEVITKDILNKINRHCFKYNNK